jgi:hypothetical protein
MQTKFKLHWLQLCTALVACCTVFNVQTAKADEGMWLTMMLQRINYADMKRMGLKLSAEELYSVNKSSLKDAIGGLTPAGNFQNHFCTGELISQKGLLLTNHHCAYDAIQSHSTVKNNFLRDGFWAKSFSEELPCKDVNVSFLVRMEEVTQRILTAVKDAKDEGERAKLAAAEIAKITAEATKDTHYNAYVKDFYKGNDYYLFVVESFKDVRLVGNPAEAIGKFGGDTDNWMWPRHTGDFSFFRVYMGKDGKPADYSPDNVPYIPKHSLPISLKGVKQNDFTMVMGYPGRTDRYRAASGIQLDMEETNPARIKLRTKRLALMKEGMDKSDAVRIKYASKYASLSNYWKYFIGQNQGLKRLKTLDYKRNLEAQYQAWADKGTNAAYKTALADINKGYADLKEVSLFNTYRGECIFGVELLQQAQQLYSIKQMLGRPDGAKMKDNVLADVKEGLKDYFKDYNAGIDRKTFAAMLSYYYKDVPKAQHADIFAKIANDFDNDFNAYAEYVFDNSFLASKGSYLEFLETFDETVLLKDPAYLFAESFAKKNDELRPKILAANAAIDKGMRTYLAGLREMNPKTTAYPDANSTLRLTYGKVIDYKSRDAVKYDYKTNISGIMEKEDPSNEEFIVPAKLAELYKNRDFGMYAENGTLPVGFITDNDITGGNSGSPVINANGELIGTAFDGNWEAMTGDLVFDKDFKRCINVDIRYTLFVVEKIGGATNLIQEMKIVK